MSLTKSDWEKIRDELITIGGVVEFENDGARLCIRKTQIGEFDLGLVVYINNINNPCWGFPDHSDREPKYDKYMSRHSKPHYSPKRKKELIKAYGKRVAKKEFNIDATTEYWLPWFTSFRSFKAAYNKIADLTLVKLGYGE